MKLKNVNSHFMKVSCAYAFDYGFQTVMRG